MNIYKEIKFNYIELNNKLRGYSPKFNSYFDITKSEDIAWCGPNKPYPAELLNIEEIVERVNNWKGVSKQQKPIFQRFNINSYALKEINDLSYWNGCVFIDLDLQKCQQLEERYKSDNDIYNKVIDVISFVCEDELFYNWLYSEKSSRRKGMHILFYFDVEKTQEVFDVVASWVKTTLINKVKENSLEIAKVLETEGVFDIVYKRPYQKCYVTGYDYKINKYCDGQFDKNLLTALLEKDETKQRIYSNNISIDSYENVKHKKVNKKFKLEHPDRLQIYLALRELYKNKEIVDAAWRYVVENNFVLYDNYTLEKFFKEPDANDWYNRPYKGKPSLLKKFGFEYDVNRSYEVNYSTHGAGLEIKTYLSEEYMDLIKSMISNNNVCTIIGNTGIGKTETIKKLIIENNGIVLVPFNSLREIYTHKEKEQHISYLSIFPEIYETYIDKINIVGKDENNIFKPYNPNMANSMVYDQCVNIKDEELYGKTIFIDESHIVFSQQDFRYKLVSLFEKLLRLKEHCKIVLVSATPLKEAELLGSTQSLRFWKSRPIINTKIITVNNASYNIQQLMKKQSNSDVYNRVMIYSDLSARALYDNARLLEGKNADKTISILHRDFWNKDDENNRMNQILKNELVDTKIVIGTSFVYNGINFQNKGEHNLVIIDFIEGADLDWKIIQAAGRLRNSTCDLIILYQPRKSDDNRLLKLHEGAELANRMKGIDLPKGLFNVNGLLSNEDYVKAMENIIEYKMANSNLETLKQTLDDWGYFNITDEIDNTNEEGSKIENKLKHKINEKFIEVILNNPRKEVMDKLIEESKKDFEGVEYFADILRCLRKILNKYNLSIEYFVSFARANMDTLKTAQELDKIFNKIVLDEREWGELVGAVKANWNKGNIFDKGIQTQQQREIDKTDEYRELYKDKLIKCPLIDAIYNKETDFKYCKYGVLKSYLQNEIKRKNEKAEINKNKRLNKGKEITYKGITYNNISEAMEQTGKSKQAIYQWIKKNG